MNDKDLKFHEELDDKVSWKGLGVIFTVILFIFGWLFTMSVRSSDKVEETKNRVSTVEVDLRGLRTDVAWIKDYLQKKL